VHLRAGNPKPQSLRHALADGAYAAGAAASESYFSAFALHLQASVTQLALLTGVPQLLGSLAQLLSVWAWRRGRARQGLLLAGVLAQAASLPLMALLPWLFPQQAAAWFITCVVLYFSGHHFAVPQWQSLMGDLVPARQRGRYFARRTRLSQAASFLALMGFGLLLHGLQAQGWARAGFVLLCLVAGGLRLVSWWHLSRMRDPRPTPPPGAADTRWLPLSVPGYLHFVAFASLMAGSVAVASPFFSYLMLERLHFSYAEFMLNSSGFIVAAWWVLPWWGRCSDRRGHAWVLWLTALVIPFLPLLWTLTTAVWLLFLLQALGGLLWSGFNLASSNLLYELLHGRHAGPYLAFHHICMGVAMFAGAQAGGWLVLHAPLVWHFPGNWSWDWGEGAYVAFAVSAALRLLVAAAFLPGLQRPAPALAPAPAVAAEADEAGTSAGAV
jgi:MFS family permease